MNIFAQKSKTSHQSKTAKSPVLGRQHHERSSMINSISHLQRTIGNQALQQMLQAKAKKVDVGMTSVASTRSANEFSRNPEHPHATGFLQTKLAINDPGDEYEQEAEEVSDRVVRMHSPGEAPTSDVVPRQGGALLPSDGRPLDSGVREFMEPRLGADLSNVRVHTDSVAAATAQGLRARAFALGSDIGFGDGEYRPETDDGRKLLAHELTHTLQAGVGVVRRSPISDNIQEVWDANPTLNALLARLSQADVQGAQSDSDIDSKIAALLAGRAGELWVAQRIRRGRLGETRQARPVEAHFIQGTTDRKALVIAGVHGEERQGIEVARMLLADLATTQPIYTVIVVPSLFPDNAVTRDRQGATPTNRNFPPPNEDLATATAAGGGTAVDATTTRSGARMRAILPENIMLLQLIERFGPERIISIHGTRYGGAGGVFYDPIRLTPAQIARARSYARGLAYMQVPVEEHGTEEGQERLRQAEERNFLARLNAMVDQDRVLSLEAASQIDAATTSITGRERRSMKRSGERTITPATRARRHAHPSVAGNVGPSGNIDTAFWSGRVRGGVSLGGYASQRGISIFTVEPPLNRETADYPTSRDTEVDAAERRIELQAYADAVRTVLLGG